MAQTKSGAKKSAPKSTAKKSTTTKAVVKKDPAMTKTEAGLRKDRDIKKADSKASLADNLNTDAATNTNAPVVGANINKAAKAGTVVSTKHSTGKWLVTEKNADGSLKSQYLSDVAKGDIVR